MYEEEEGEWSESEYDNDNVLIYSESGTDELKEFSKEIDFGLIQMTMGV